MHTLNPATINTARNKLQADHGSVDPDTGAAEYPGDGVEYVGELMEISEGIRALQAAPDTVVEDLSTLIKRLAHSLRKAAPDNELADQAVDYLRRNNISGSPYRAAQPEERKYICPVRTVADLANNLLMMDQELPIYGAQYIEHNGRRQAIAVSPTVSRERVKAGRWIGEGDVLNAAIVWTRAAQTEVQRVPLTDQAIATIAAVAFIEFMEDKNDDADLAMARAIEAAHGIRPADTEGGAP